MTLREWANTCREALLEAGVWFGHGTDNAADEAAWLVLAATGRAVDGQFTEWDTEVANQHVTSIERLLQQRLLSGQPLAYLTGEAWFCGHKFLVNNNVLVPRSPIAELVHKRFSPWVDCGKIASVLDLCTGSGCIGIAIALEMPWLKVDATDLSSAALKVAAKNVQFLDVKDRVELIRSDLFDSLAGRRYGLIVSNPPYVSKPEFDALPSEYHSEPEMALLTGMNGLEITLKILSQSVGYLASDGVLICEVGENAELLQSELPNLPLTWLEFENGGGGVFMIGQESLLNHGPDINAVIERLRNVA